MNRKWTYSVAALAVALVLVSGIGCKKLRARDDLNKGVQAFRSARYSDAVDKFKEAIELDPTFPTARLYLAIAYFQQWIPGAGTIRTTTRCSRRPRSSSTRCCRTTRRTPSPSSIMAQLNYSETQGIKDLTRRSPSWTRPAIGTSGWPTSTRRTRTPSTAWA